MAAEKTSPGLVNGELVLVTHSPRSSQSVVGEGHVMKKNALRREKKLTDVIVKRLNELKRGGGGGSRLFGQDKGVDLLT